MRIKILSYISVILFLVFGAHQAGAIVFTDGTFSTGDWSSSVLVRGPNGGTGTATQVTSGGNPGSYWEVFAQKNATTGTGQNGSTWVFSLNSAATYDLSVSGAIATIDFSIDAKQFVQFPVSGGTVSPLIFQNGGLYIASGVSVPESTWTLKQVLGLTQTDFVRAFDFVNPDFSTAGGLITLGFAYTVSTPINGGDSIRTAGFDNWSMTVNPVSVSVPEPATLGLFGIGLLGACFAARRRKQA